MDTQLARLNGGPLFQPRARGSFCGRAWPRSPNRYGKTMRLPETFELIANYAAESLEKKQQSFWKYLARIAIFRLRHDSGGVRAAPIQAPRQVRDPDAGYDILHPPPKRATHVELVVIDETDYKETFHESSPPQVDALEKVIGRTPSGNPALSPST
jgi:hypothetical protein